jgi:hypothetical protein
MNLGKLLGAGKSFFGGRGVVAYRADKRVYLPKFNSAKNPFESKPAAEPAPAATGATVAPVPACAKAKMKPGMIPVFTAPKPPRGGSWTDRINPFRGPAPVAAAAALAKPVQTEMSLQAVKVLHNDLTDADVEVVPVKSRTLATVEAPRLLPTREPLEFFGERRFETA